MGKGLSAANGAGKCVSTHRRMRTNPYLTPYTAVSSKENTNLNVRPETIKPPEEIIAGKLHDVGMGSNLLDMTPKPQITRAKRRQRGLHST